MPRPAWRRTDPRAALFGDPKMPEISPTRAGETPLLAGDSGRGRAQAREPTHLAWALPFPQRSQAARVVVMAATYIPPRKARTKPSRRPRRPCTGTSRNSPRGETPRARETVRARTCHP
jgi:hypothetical protein